MGFLGASLVKCVFTILSKLWAFAGHPDILLAKSSVTTTNIFVLFLNFRYHNIELQILKANDIGKSALLLMYLFLVLSDHVKMNHSLPTQTDFQLLHAAWHESTAGNPSAFTS